MNNTGNQEINPITRLDYPDPDVIRVDNTYYMVSTTMHFMPGCEILRSYDLVNWEHASYVYDVLDSTPGQKIEGEENIYGQGMWAASLRYHKGIFYVCFVANDTGKTYIYSAPSIEGPWKKSYIKGFYHDCSILFDDDDRVYIASGNKYIRLQELDLDGALKRQPQLILVDELAHTNAPGCRHAKRYQDVQELLRAGISVYTTVNVQHLESLNDMVASITGITVAERIPDSVFDSADQVEVTDLEPADLLERLRAGKIYRGPQAAQAIGHFFTDKNLAALREIALRRTADRLERNTEDEDGSRPKIGEHILICLSGAPSNAKVIRTAARMAEAFHGAFTALFVETPQFATQSEADRARLRANLHLAEQLGARITTVYGDDPAIQIAE